MRGCQLLLQLSIPFRNMLPLQLQGSSLAPSGGLTAFRSGRQLPQPFNLCLQKLKTVYSRLKSKAFQLTLHKR